MAAATPTLLDLAPEVLQTAKALITILDTETEEPKGLQAASAETRE